MTHPLAIAIVALTALGLVGCGSQGQDLLVQGEACMVSQTPFPADGEPRAYFRTSVDVGWSDPVPESATLELLDTTGQVVPGTVRAEGRVQTLVPDAPLVPGQTYTVESAFTCANNPIERRFEWTVGEVGSPVSADVWSGKTYVLDLADPQFNRWLQPRRVAFGAFLSRYLEPKLRLTTKAVNGGVSVSVALQDPETSEQHLCAQVVEGTDTIHQSQNPAFQVGLPDFAFRSRDGDVRIDAFDVKVKGAFSPEGTYIGGGGVQMLLDIGPLGEIYGPNRLACRGLESEWGEGCVPCPRGDSLTCVAIEVEHLRAEAAESQESVDVCADEVCTADPDCVD